MKIGILSMQKILNYGSFLQAYSLKKEFEKRGHEVYFIDIENGKQIVKSEVPKVNYFRKLIQGKIFKRIQNYFMSKKMSRIHVEDYTKYLETDKVLPLDQNFDLVIIGSDEVFNCTTPSRWGFSTQLFGKIDRANRVVTYAASCGQTNYEKVKELGLVNELREAMNNVYSFSVRDENTREFVKNITQKESFLHLDPVFLYNYECEMQPIKNKKPYLLIYAYSNRINDKNEIKAIKSYAKQKGLEIICVGQQQRWCKNNICANAFELLSFFDGADSVITDTFHGAVLSIKYNKRFGVLVRDSNLNKLGGLLKTFGLENRMLDKENYSSVMEQTVDFNSVNQIIDTGRKQSCEYFDMVVEN